MRYTHQPVYLNVRLAFEVKDKIAKLAAADGLSLSEAVRLALDEYVERHERQQRV